MLGQANDSPEELIGSQEEIYLYILTHRGFI